MVQFTTMNNILLLTRPNHDNLTNYLFFWCQPIIEIAQRKRFSIHDLSKKKANKKELEGHLRARKVGLVFFNGHGNEETIAGYADEPLIQLGNNEDILNGTIVYIRSCQVMQKLGDSVVAKGARACIGYRRKFWVYMSTNYVTHPMDDPYAKSFLEPSNLVVSTLLKGNTVEEALKRSQQAMRKNRMRMLSTAGTNGERAMAFALGVNIRGQTLGGDPQAKL